MNLTFETIEAQLREELLSLQNYPPVERYNASVILVNKAIADLKEHLKKMSLPVRKRRSSSSRR
ncbi:hypothetical protein ACRQ5D_31275 [Mucilaginibacter sp. P25]|uniref:hypothetical protein n=1 Tax=Mucilaginibacter sp. P25 TaxID=3423945 RepID=UPI003D7A860B